MAFVLNMKHAGTQSQLQFQQADPEVSAIAEQIVALTGLSPATLKLLGAGKALVPATLRPGITASGAGLKPGSSVMVVGSKAADVDGVLGQTQRAALDRLPGFEHEMHVAAARRRRAARDLGPPPAGTKHTFGSYEVMRSPGLTPGPEEALKLLYRLASDAGIMAVMDKHGFNVGKLAEMPPEGLVGVDPVCVLGLNTNRGETIHLRLRTDDIKGFRKYESIRGTLVHELTHNVWGDHDNRFKALCSQLNKEVDEVHMRLNQAGRFAVDTAVDWDTPEGRPGGGAGGRATTLPAAAPARGMTLRQAQAEEARQRQQQQQPAARLARPDRAGAAAAVAVGQSASAPAAAQQPGSGTGTPGAAVGGGGLDQPQSGGVGAPSQGATPVAEGEGGRMEAGVGEEGEGGQEASAYEHFDVRTEELERKQRALEE